MWASHDLWFHLSTVYGTYSHSFIQLSHCSCDFHNSECDANSDACSGNTVIVKVM